MLKGVSIKAVLAGFFVDLVLTIGGAIGLAIATLVFLHTRAHHPGHNDTTAFHHLSHSAPVLLIDLLIGGGAGMIGGAVTGWMAPSPRMKSVTALWIVDLVLSLPFLPFMVDLPLWYNVAAFLVTVLATIAGGWLAVLIFDQGPS